MKTQAKQTEEKEYDDIPGTFVFDAERSRRGYHINMFCMSLMKAENRKAFKENEEKYLDTNFPLLQPEQRDAILKRPATDPLVLHTQEGPKRFSTMLYPLLTWQEGPGYSDFSFFQILNHRRSESAGRDIPGCIALP